MNRGGPFSHAFEKCREKYRFGVHGVAMNLAGPDPFDEEHTSFLKKLLDDLDVDLFSEHLCWSRSHGHQSFDLLPLPFTEEAVLWSASRIREMQDRLERPIAIENVSTYAIVPGGEMDEGSFHRAVCEEADCDLLLDVNNVYVNAINHGYDPVEHLRSFPLARATQMHLAGHDERGDFLIDSHGAPVCDPVWELYKVALSATGDIPVLIEWDTNIPPLDTLLDQADYARKLQKEFAS